MANFKVIIKKESFLELTVTAKDKIDASILAIHKAKNREGWIDDSYDIVEIKSL